MSPETSSPEDALDPIKIRADIAPIAQGPKTTEKNASRLRWALTGSVLAAFLCLAFPLFSPVDARAETPLLNSDQVIIFTDPPGAKISTGSLNNQGRLVGFSGTPLLIDDVFRDDSSPTGSLESVVLFIGKDGYTTSRQTLTPMDLGAKVWPQEHQPILRLAPADPAVLFTDYLPNNRPALFVGLCVSLLSSLILGALLWRQTRQMARQERVRQQTKEEDPLTGLSILGHEVLNRLGKGATAFTYRAVCEKDWSTMRVLRFNRLASISSQELEERRREIGIHQKLDHPNIVKFYEAQNFQNSFVMVMELIGGGDLEKFLKTHTPLAPDQALPIFEKMASALDYAHAQGITHRDLKPANVMLHEDLSPAVIDFGMAKDASVAKLTQTGTIKGTILYMAPEQIVGIADRVGPKTDQFAFGLMLYLSLSGYFAYQVSDDPMTAVTERISGKAIPLKSAVPNVPQQVSDVIMRMLSYDPDERFPTISEGMVALRRAFQETQWDLKSPLS